MSDPSAEPENPRDLARRLAQEAKRGLLTKAPTLPRNPLPLDASETLDMDAQAPRVDRSVVVVDVKMPFVSMVVFMVKWAFASIPALIIVSTVFAILSVVFSSLALTATRLLLN